MDERTELAELPFRIEKWTPEGRPVALVGAAVDQDIALAIARRARQERPKSRVKLYGRPMTKELEKVGDDVDYMIELWAKTHRLKILGIAKSHLSARDGFRAAAVPLYPGQVMIRRHGKIIADTSRGDV